MLALPGLARWVGEELVGIATLGLPDAERMELAVVAVASGHRGQGHGAALVEAAAASAARSGASEMWLVTTNDNLDALRLYQRHGFRLSELHAGALDEARKAKPEIGRYRCLRHPLAGRAGAHTEAQALSRPRTILGCVATGAALCLSLPPWGWWPLAFVGLVGLDRLIADQPFGARLARGYGVALTLFLPGLYWIGDLTLPGWLIAAVVYSAMLGLGIAAVPPGRGRWLALPGTWALAELLRWTWPFGGVPLANLAIGQVAGPLAPVARVAGSLGLVIVTVLAGTALAAATRRCWSWAAGLARGRLVIVALAMVAPRGHEVDSIEAALVQGGGPQGTRAEDTNERVVFERHLEASELVRASRRSRRVAGGRGRRRGPCQARTARATSWPTSRASWTRPWSSASSRAMGTTSGTRRWCSSPTAASATATTRCTGSLR